ncbi:S-layer homology domain-containing protein [Demequina sp. SYSU T00192]|uniref:S-layer homology domain-containing protein n=1 Tax=Demequina litoralis TaxID=3051660 RepID=A0ABT8GAG0_9MICO|nr:S-layer homology domain-containing protein [Demequina sp. SYSU T00192]MDN4475684.1 S-layer homology domain-containing protein [Demequina sp. SYSU T00192]
MLAPTSALARFGAALAVALMMAVGAPSAADAAATRTIAGQVSGGDVDSGWAKLYTWKGDLVDRVDIEDGVYRFEGVKAGGYKVLVGGIPGRSRQWAEYWETTIAPVGVTAFPGRIGISSSSPSTVWARPVELDTSTPLMVRVRGKESWTSDVLCVAAYRYPLSESTQEAIAANSRNAARAEAWERPVSIDCTRPGRLAILDEVAAGEQYILRIVPRNLRTVELWQSYSGDDFWYGNYDELLRWTHPAAVGDVLVLGERTVPPTLVTVKPRVRGQRIDAAHFTDVDGEDGAFGAISWVGSHGIAKGYSDGRYGPTDVLTRRQMAMFLYRYAGSPRVDLPGRSPFTDIGPGDTGYKAVVWLHQEGIATGYDDGTFRDTAPLSRRQMAWFLFRYSGDRGYDAPKRSPFTDIGPGDPGYRAIAWVHEHGVATGYGDGTYRDTDALTRQQMAFFLTRYSRL